jgi:hypothetical protein
MAMRQEVSDQINSSRNFSIDLRNLAINDEEIEKIVLKIKKQNPGIQNIILRNNNITDKGAISLAKLIRSFLALRLIDLQFNDINIKGAEALMSLRQDHSNLVIALHGNKIIDEAVMTKIQAKYTKTQNKM